MSDPETAASNEEAAVKRLELRARKIEAEQTLAAARAPWWRRADTLTVAVLAGALTLLGNAWVAYLNSQSTRSLEEAKARYNLVLQAMATNSEPVARRNIHFFIDAGLLADPDCKIRRAIDQDSPVLPALAATVPPTQGSTHWAPEIAALYDFPTELDGRGETIGLLELAGGVQSSDLNHYFATLSLPVPEVSVVTLDGTPDDAADVNESGEVMLDLEVAGSIAPRAHMNVYFAPPTAKGFADVIRRAANDHVAVLAVGWGLPEPQWSDSDIATVNDALQRATLEGVTVVVAAGDQGVSDGAPDGKPHVSFPASSPWVLAVGGTSLKAQDGRIVSEAPWKGDTSGFATGSGSSDRIPRPAWQAGLTSASAPNALAGRTIPDVAASADPTLGTKLF